MNYYSLISSMSKTPSVDADAQAFITAASITNATQKSAVNTLVSDLKTYGIWSKMKAIYPMVGGSAFSHKFNLKDPRDLDAAFRINFVNGWTHSATGAKPNGTDGYGNTNINLFSTFGGTSLSISTYIRQSAYKGIFAGVNDLVSMPGGTFDSVVYIGAGNNTTLYTFMGNTWSEALSGTVTDLKGLVMGNRNSSNTIFTLKKNGTTINTSTGATVRYYPSISYSIGAFNEKGTNKYFDDNEIAFHHLSDGLTDTEASNFYTAVQAFNTTLSRNV